MKTDKSESSTQHNNAQDESDSNTASTSALQGVQGNLTHLRQLREDAKLSLSEISVQTNIPEHTLQHFESENFSRVGSDLFVVAYIRKYTKILNVEAEPYVMGYRASGGIEGDEFFEALDAKDGIKPPKKSAKKRETGTYGAVGKKSGKWESPWSFYPRF